MRSKTSRGEGLVPRWGRVGEWQNRPRQLAVPSHNSSFSYLGVPAATGMSDWYESMSRTRIRDDVTRPRVCPHSTAPPPVGPAPTRHSGEARNPEGRGWGNVVRAACPPLGRRRGVAESAVPVRRIKPYSSFSYLGVPAAGGMSDWYESMSRTPIRDDVTRPRVCLNAAAPALVVPAPQFVIPAKAGIHALTSCERTPSAIPPPTSTRRPHFVFPAKAPPEPRYGAGIQKGWGGANVVRSKTSRGEGLVPRWGRGGERQKPPRQLDSPNPQLRVFIRWCAGPCRHERLVRKQDR